jgi:hypothetical protein
MKALIAALALALSACATQSTAPTQHYRAAGQADQIAISGTLRQKPGFMTREMNNDVSILINGQVVASGNFTGGAIELTGFYSGKPVLADCSAIASGAYAWGGMNPANVRCIVTIAGERAAALLLVP